MTMNRSKRVKMFYKCYNFIYANIFILIELLLKIFLFGYLFLSEMKKQNRFCQKLLVKIPSFP